MPTNPSEDTMTTTDTTTTETEARAAYDRAHRLVTEWQHRLDDAKAAQAAAEQTAPNDVLDHPDAIEEIVAARTATREKVRATEEVLGRAHDAVRMAGKALLPFARDKYLAEAARADHDRTAWHDKLDRLVAPLVAHTGMEIFRAEATGRTYEVPFGLGMASLRARRSARLCELAIELDDMPTLWDEYIRGNTVASPAWHRLRDALGTELFGGPNLFGGVKLDPVATADLPAELQANGVYPIV